ncbi:hypothetical protein HanRHA438_Chr13g0583641 [Helianthus annuus]|nr:hypothetical protein HanRHA438_Chr13g0583641 [Helianthus annuus]
MFHALPNLILQPLSKSSITYKYIFANYLDSLLTYLTKRETCQKLQKRYF